MKTKTLIKKTKSFTDKTLYIFVSEHNHVQVYKYTSIYGDSISILFLNDNEIIGYFQRMGHCYIGYDDNGVMLDKTFTSACDLINYLAETI